MLPRPTTRGLYHAAYVTLARFNAVVAPQVAAAACGPDANPVSRAVPVAVALVPFGAHGVAQIHAPLASVHGRGAEAQAVAVAALVGSTAIITDSRFAFFAPPSADHHDVQRRLAHSALRPDHTREQREQPATTLGSLHQFFPRAFSPVGDAVHLQRPP